jgi:hypothetical protein
LRTLSLSRLWGFALLFSKQKADENVWLGREQQRTTAMEAIEICVNGFKWHE